MGRLFLLVTLIGSINSDLVAMHHSNPEEAEQRGALIKRTMPSFNSDFLNKVRSTKAPLTPTEKQQIIEQIKAARKNTDAAIYIMHHGLNAIPGANGPLEDNSLGDCQ